MKVVFLEEVEGTASTGDVKNVADGFARNFLLPRRLAAPATDHYIAIAQSRATKQARLQAKLDEDAQKILPLVDGQEVTIEVRVGEQEKLFGSVTARDVAELLQGQTKVELEHKQVDIKQPIRELGSHPVPVKLTRNVVAQVTVHVIPVGGVLEEPSPEPEVEAEAVAEASDETTAVAVEPEDEDAPKAEAGDPVEDHGSEGAEETQADEDGGAEQTS